MAPTPSPHAPNPIRIFLSHSHTDNDFGIQLARDLRRRLGDDDAVWLDASTRGLQGGDAWWGKIRKELRERPVFLVVLSPDAMDSPWVNNEIDLAWMQRNSPEGKIILPVLYRPCEPRDDLKTLQILSFLPPKSYAAAFGEVLAALGIATKSQAASASQPQPLYPNYPPVWSAPRPGVTPSAGATRPTPSTPPTPLYGAPAPAPPPSIPAATPLLESAPAPEVANVLPAAPPLPNSPAETMPSATPPNARRTLVPVVSMLLVVALLSGFLILRLSHSPQGSGKQSARTTPTATIQATTTTGAGATGPYLAAIPGPAGAGGSCSVGNGKWLFQHSSLGTYACTLDGTTVTINSPANDYGLLVFEGRPAPWTFPTNYSFSVDISGLSGQACILFEARVSQNKQQFDGARLCPGGNWDLDVDDRSANTNKIIAQSPMPNVGSAFHVELTYSGPTQTLFINGNRMGSGDNGAYLTTSALALILYGYPNVTSSATFANFSFSPLPS